MKQAPFEVQVSDYTVSPEEWLRAQEAPRSKLPELSQEQKEVARKFRISEEEYARGVLAGRYGQERMKERARRLGDAVQKVLAELGSGDQVAAVVGEMDKLRWIVGVKTSGQVVYVAVPRDLADDIVDWSLQERMQELKARILRGLGAADAETSPQ